MSEKIETLNGIGTYKLKKPTKIDGNAVTEINYNLADLNGASIRKVRTELGKRSYVVSVQELDVPYQAALFAEASGLTIENIESLSMVDYTNISNIVRDFLMGEE